jgi:hypothetical protein
LTVGLGCVRVYRMSTQEEKDFIARHKSTKKLLKQFGLEPYAYDPGVRCTPIKRSGSPRFEDICDFGENEWKWLAPLLRELVRLRKLVK